MSPDDMLDYGSPDDMLDYGLGLLDPIRHEQLEREAAADPRLAEQLDRLGGCLHRLLDDGLEIEPPPGLARRTIVLIDRCRRWVSVRDLAPARGSLRLADLAVAAGIFIAGLLTLIPAVSRSQISARTAQCTQNLHELGVALIRYATTHNNYPYPPPDKPAAYAGTFANILHDQGLLDDPRVLDCPGNGPNPLPPVLPTLAEVNAQEARAPRTSPCLVHSDYAYNIGYSPDGRPRPLPAVLPGGFALVSDRPVFDEYGRALPGNSANHGRSGQNVLTAGGDVRFARTTRFGADPDIFHNRRNATAPGIDPSDYVLGSPVTRFDGKCTPDPSMPE